MKRKARPSAQQSKRLKRPRYSFCGSKQNPSATMPTPLKVSRKQQKRRRGEDISNDEEPQAKRTEGVSALVAQKPVPALSVPQQPLGNPLLLDV